LPSERLPAHTRHLPSAYGRYAAFVRLRVARPELPRPYRVPLGTRGCAALLLLPVLVRAFIMYVSVAQSRAALLWCAAATALGLALGAPLLRRSGAGMEPAMDPGREPDMEPGMGAAACAAGGAAGGALQDGGQEEGGSFAEVYGAPAAVEVDSFAGRVVATAQEQALIVESGA
jgi:hypothetical protein